MKIQLVLGRFQRSWPFILSLFLESRNETNLHMKLNLFQVLSERREELNKLKDQAMTQRDDVEGLDRMLGKKKTELQLLQVWFVVAGLSNTPF